MDDTEGTIDTILHEMERKLDSVPNPCDVYLPSQPMSRDDATDGQNMSPRL